MIEKSLRARLDDHYRKATLSPDALMRLRSLVSDAPQLADAHPAHANGRGVFTSIFLVAAFVVAALLLGTGYWMGHASRPVAKQVVGAVEVERGEPFRRGVSSPELIAVNLYAAWCPRCPTVTRIFSELRKKHRDEPILFVTLDVTDEERRLAAQDLASALHVEWALGRLRETGAITLVDPGTRTVLETLTGEGGVERMEVALAGAGSAQRP